MGVRPVRGGLADLLERALDRGLVLHADVLITLSGVPLIALNLRLLLASVETMLRYGVMTDWLQARGPDRRSVLDRGSSLDGLPAAVPPTACDRSRSPQSRRWSLTAGTVEGRRLSVAQRAAQRL